MSRHSLAYQFWLCVSFFLPAGLVLFLGDLHLALIFLTMNVYSMCLTFRSRCSLSQGSQILCLSFDISENLILVPITLLMCRFVPLNVRPTIVAAELAKTLYAKTPAERNEVCSLLL